MSAKETMGIDTDSRYLEPDCTTVPNEVEDFCRRLQACLSRCCKSMPDNEKLKLWKENGGASLLAELAATIGEGGRISDSAILFSLRQLTIDQLRILWAYLTAQLTAAASESSITIDLDLLVTWLDLLLTANFNQLAAGARSSGDTRLSSATTPISAASLAGLSEIVNNLAELQFQRARLEALLDSMPIVTTGLADKLTASGTVSSQSSYSIVKVTL